MNGARQAVAARLAVGYDSTTYKKEEQEVVVYLSDYAYKEMPLPPIKEDEPVAPVQRIIAPR